MMKIIILIIICIFYLIFVDCDLQIKICTPLFLDLRVSKKNQKILYEELKKRFK